MSSIGEKMSRAYSVPPAQGRMTSRRDKLAAMMAMAILAATFLIAQASDLRSVSGVEKIQSELLAKMEASDQVAVTEQLQAEGSEEPQPRIYRIIVNLKAPQGEQTQTMDYQSEAGLSQLQRQVTALQDAVLQAPTRGYLKVLYRYKNVYGFSAEANREAILDLVKIGEVEFVEEIPVMHKMDAESLPLTNTDDVHNAGYTGKGVTIAIIDDGIDHDHPAFGGSVEWPNAKILGGHDFGDNDNDPRIDCVDQSHGTAVAGVATGNGGGVTGTAPDARIVFLKVQRAVECGQHALSGDIVGAIDWAVSNRERYGINIISMSLGGGAFDSPDSCDAFSPMYTRIVNAAHAAGMIVLAAAGNDGRVGTLSHPACLSNVISVGATYDADIGPAGFSICSDPITDADLVTCYSNSAAFLDILAPSHCALTAKAGGGLDTCFGGTSSATPFAAGVAATLLEAANGDLDNDAMRSLLVDNGVEILDHRNNLVTPRIDAEASLQALLSPGGGGDDSNQLENGVPVADLAASTGEELHFTMDVPAGVRNLAFAISGGVGDADVYVKFGSQPTVSTYDCRPYLVGNREVCAVSSPSPGTWHVMIRAYRTFSGVTLVGQFSEAGAPPCDDCEHYTGSLSGPGFWAVQPNGTYYFSFAGTHQGWLEGPAGANFELELYRWSGFGWWKVAQSTGPGSSESVKYVGTSGYYFWRVVSQSGSGSYDFWLERP